MASTNNKKVTFVESNEARRSEKDSKLGPSQFRKVPAFCTQRLLKSMSNTSSTASMVVKEQHTPNLEKMSLSELHELLDKQEKLCNNKLFISKLKDKGEKIIALQDKIKKQIEIRKKLDTTENMLANLSVTHTNAELESLTKYAYINKKEHILQNSKQVINSRFNMPKTSDSKMSKELNSKMDVAKISVPQEIKTLDLDESLKTMELSCCKERNVFRDQLIRFYAYRTQADDDDEESSLSEYEDSDY